MFELKLSGRKIPNKLCAAAIAVAKAYCDDTLHLAETATMDNFFTVMSAYAKSSSGHNPRTKPIVVEWSHRLNGSKAIGIWENKEAVWMKASALAYVRIKEVNNG